jgi:hypothetical protein
VLVVLRQALLQPPLLLVLGNVKEEFDDGRPFVGEKLLERIDVMVTAFPDLLRHQIVHALDQHTLVV